MDAWKQTQERQNETNRRTDPTTSRTRGEAVLFQRLNSAPGILLSKAHNGTFSFVLLLILPEPPTQQEAST